MTLNELKGKYARLSHEIDELTAAGVHHEARLMRLLNDLDQVHRELSELRRRTLAAPTLRDEVQPTAPVVVAPRAVVVPLGAAPTVSPRPAAIPVRLSLAV